MSDLQQPAAPRGALGSSIIGGVIGSAVTAAVLIFAAPHLISTRVVRDGLLSSPQILSEAVDALQGRTTVRPGMPSMPYSRSATMQPRSNGSSNTMGARNRASR